MIESQEACRISKSLLTFIKDLTKNCYKVHPILQKVTFIANCDETLSKTVSVITKPESTLSISFI